MRSLTALLLVVPLLSGCLDAGEVFSNDPDTAPCTEEVVDHTFWLGGALSLRPTEPSGSGRTPGNAFQYAFVSDTADEWWSEPFADGIRILGDVTLEVWIERGGAPSTIIPSIDDPTSTDGWQLFSQFGSDHGFAGTYHNAYTEPAVEPGTVHHITQTFTMPEGGLVLERGDMLRLLMTNMAPDLAPGNPNHHVLWGGDTPSAVSFEAVCYIDRAWDLVDASSTDIAISGNAGLLTGAVPDQEGVTHQSVPFTLDSTTERLTIMLEEGGDVSSTPKDDMDLVVLDDQGTPVWSIGSPYANEKGRFWQPNLEYYMPYGDYVVQVRSYSGFDYTGALTITQETSAE